MLRIKCVLLLFVILCSCKHTEKNRISSLVKDLYGKEILFPKELNFTLLNGDTIDYVLDNSKYRIVHYVDSTGCMSCKLKLFEWKRWVAKLRSDFSENVDVIFVFSNKNVKEMMGLLEREMFNYPFFLDTLDVFNHLNKLPADFSFHTFLLNQDNQIVAIGNPVYNMEVGKLYLKIIRGEKIKSDRNRTEITEVSVDRLFIPLGCFSWQVQQKGAVIFKNVGDNPLVIEHVSTSCGCIATSYSKEPIRPNDTTSLFVMYKAEQPEYFDKTIKVYCNTKSSPILVRITGDAK